MQCKSLFHPERLRVAWARQKKKTQIISRQLPMAVRNGLAQYRPCRTAHPQPHSQPYWVKRQPTSVRQLSRGFAIAWAVHLPAWFLAATMLPNPLGLGRFVDQLHSLPAVLLLPHCKADPFLEYRQQCSKTSMPRFEIDRLEITTTPTNMEN